MVCENLFKQIDELNEKYLSILEDVCNIESPTSLKEGVDKVGDYFIEMAKEKGWKIEVSKQEVSGDAICITLNPNAKDAPICLSGHMDTVHPVGLFGSPPVKRDENNMYGPGVMDCKGGIVAAFMAMDALEKCGFNKRPVKLILQSDEENSSVSSNKKTIDFMCEKAKDSALFLNLEGYVKGTAVVERKGILKCKFKVYGKAAHASKCTEASNAIAEAASKILKLEEFKNADGITISCDVIKGGTAINTVAEYCEFFTDIRFSNQDELNFVRQKIKEIADISYIKGCSCELEEVGFRPAMAKSEKNYELLEKMNKIYSENNLPTLSPRKNVSGSDAAYITLCDIPCIDSIGTEGKYIHSAKEYITLSSLSESAKRIASVVYCI